MLMVIACLFVCLFVVCCAHISMFWLLCARDLTQRGDEKLLRKLEHFQEKLDGMDEEAKKQILHDKAVHAALLRAQGCVNFVCVCECVCVCICWQSL